MSGELGQTTLPWERPPLGLLVRLRRQLGAAVVDNFFLQSARLAGLLPLSNPALHRVQVERDLPYRETGSAAHLLDVYRPEQAAGKRPVVLYIHGGGFRFMSKDTHWVFGLAFARRGYLVININYRLAPSHPYPAALEDACAAYLWVVQHAEALGADLSRLVVAGESAGANLAAALAVVSCYRRPEPWAKQVFDTQVVPKVVIPACGVLQVSDPERFSRRKPLSWLLHDRLTEVADAYFHGLCPSCPEEVELADPVCLLERAGPPDRPLPAFFAPCGTGDPLLDDTRRLARALERLGSPCTARYYPGEMHAFHAFIFRDAARRCWRELFDHLDTHLTQPWAGSVDNQQRAPHWRST